MIVPLALFSQYGWLKNILEELRPEFFPDSEEEKRPPFEIPHDVDSLQESGIHFSIKVFPF